MVIIAYPMAGYGVEGYAEADTITDLLASGRASRLYRRLLASQAADGLFAQADASIIGSEDTGMLLLTAMLTRNGNDDIREACTLLRSELSLLREDEEHGGCSHHEMERVFNRFETDLRLRTLSCRDMAAELAMDEFHGENINERVSRRRSLTTGDIRRVASELYRSPSATVVYRPDE